MKTMNERPLVPDFIKQLYHMSNDRIRAIATLRSFFTRTIGDSSILTAKQAFDEWLDSERVEKKEHGTLDRIQSLLSASREFLAVLDSIRGNRKNDIDEEVLLDGVRRSVLDAFLLVEDLKKDKNPDL
jgi:hypothetical protein